MKPIGGFFELEVAQGNNTFHTDAQSFSNGRACLNVILRHTLPSKVYLPFCSCDTILEPITALNIPFEFYPINQHLEPLIPATASNRDVVLLINYFGLLSGAIDKWPNPNSSTIIIDNTQAFFEKGYYGKWSFNSARKWFGVPDGAYLYAPIQLEKPTPRNTQFLFSHLVNRLIGKQQQSYAEFVTAEHALDSSVMNMSILSERLLSNVNYSAVAQRRRANFLQYEAALRPINQLTWIFDDTAIPFAYPLLLDRPIDKQRLFEQLIYIPTLWPNVLTQKIEGFTFEKTFTACLLPLPIDHRMDVSDCDRVIEAVFRLL